MRFPSASLSKSIVLCLGVFIVSAVLGGISAHADPILKVRGTIVEVGEGDLLLRADGEPVPRRFLLRWKVKFKPPTFDPPKLPLKGDRVELWYKDKPEGAIIYHVNYLPPGQPEVSEEKSMMPGNGSSQVPPGRNTHKTRLGDTDLNE